MGAAWRIAVCVAWVAVLALLTTWSETTSAMWAAVAATLLAGALIGRWWVLLVPVVPAALLAVLALAAGGTDSDGTPAWKWAVFILAVGAAIVAVLAAGVALVRLIRPRPRGPRRGAPA